MPFLILLFLLLLPLLLLPLPLLFPHLRLLLLLLLLFLLLLLLLLWLAFGRSTYLGDGCACSVCRRGWRTHGIGPPRLPRVPRRYRSRCPAPVPMLTLVVPLLPGGLPGVECAPSPSSCPLVSAALLIGQHPPKDLLPVCCTCPYCTLQPRYNARG
jgi:hypothetical protein